MNRTRILISVMALLLITACGLTSGLGLQTVTGSGEIISESRPVANVDRVDVCCGMQLMLTQDSSEFLEIEADDNFMAEIETRLVNGKLDIYYQDTTNVSYRPSQAVRIYLSVEDIREVALSGGGFLQTDSIEGSRFELELSGGSEAELGSLEAEEIRFQASGGGEIRADTVEAETVNIELNGASDAWIEDLSADSLSLDTSGGGTITVAGEVDKAQIEVSGGGKLNAEGLWIAELVINASGGGSATVWVEDRLEADLSGGSSLAYYGQPEIVSQDTSGGSSINSLGGR